MVNSLKRWKNLPSLPYYYTSIIGSNPEFSFVLDFAVNTVVCAQPLPSDEIKIWTSSQNPLGLSFVLDCVVYLVVYTQSLLKPTLISHRRCRKHGKIKTRIRIRVDFDTIYYDIWYISIYHGLRSVNIVSFYHKILIRFCYIIRTSY